MNNDNIEKRFRFELELGMKYKTKYTKKNEIAYFVLAKNEPYNLLLEFENVLNIAGYRKIGCYDKNSNAVKIYLNRGSYRVIESAPFFESKTTPKNRIPDFIRKLVNYD